MLRLSDALGPLADPSEIAATAAQRLAEHLRAARVLCVEIEAPAAQGKATGVVRGMHVLDAAGVTVAAASERIVDYAARGAATLAALGRGETIVVGGEAPDAASVTVPLFRRGRWAAALEVYDAAPRVWTPTEVELIAEVAERAWDAVERARVDAALRHVEERHRRMLAIETVSVVFFDLHGGITEANDAFLRMIGFSRAELEAGEVRYDRLTPPDWTWRDHQTLAELTERGESGPFEKEYFRKDGARIWILCASKRLDKRTAVEFIVDVTERKRADQALREADRRKDEFLAMLAHELRNPLAPITNAHRLLERTQALDARGRTALEMAARQTRQLQRLVDDLLEVSRVSRGKILLKPQSMRIEAAVRDAAESVAATIEARGQSLVVVVAPGLGPVEADPARIAQVLENLLTNAIKFTPEGGTIRLEADADGDVVEIRVVDSGIGIEPAKIAGLFELFHQLDATLDRSAGGLGIGLALVKRLVELHNGTVSAASAGRGEGSTFTVRLPHRAGHSLAR